MQANKKIILATTFILIVGTLFLESAIAETNISNLSVGGRDLNFEETKIFFSDVLNFIKIFFMKYYWAIIPFVLIFFYESQDEYIKRMRKKIQKVKR